MNNYAIISSNPLATIEPSGEETILDLATPRIIQAIDYAPQYGAVALAFAAAVSVVVYLIKN